MLMIQRTTCCKTSLSKGKGKRRRKWKWKWKRKERKSKKKGKRKKGKEKKKKSKERKNKGNGKEKRGNDLEEGKPYDMDNIDGTQSIAPQLLSQWLNVVIWCTYKWEKFYFF